MELGKLPVPGRPTALEMGVGGGCLDIFTLVYHFSFLSPSLWETARNRLKYCLKGPLSPKQPTNQPIKQFTMRNSFCDFLFAFLEDETLPKGAKNLLIEEQILSFKR